MKITHKAPPQRGSHSRFSAPNGPTGLEDEVDPMMGNASGTSSPCHCPLGSSGYACMDPNNATCKAMADHETVGSVDPGPAGTP